MRARVTARACSAAGLLILSGAAAACGESLGPGTRELADAQIRLVYKTVPAVPVVGRHFALEIALCPTASAAAPATPRGNAPATLSVDAHMPEHRHGMNYRPSVSRRGPGLYRAQGLMFHMPGRWELVFELRDAAGTMQRLTQTLTID